MSKLEEIAGLKYRLSKLQFQSDLMKSNFFNYIEKLSPDFNIISNVNLEDCTFEIYGNKLKLIGSYNKDNQSFQGVFTIFLLTTVDNKEVYNNLLFWVFDSIGNIKNVSSNYTYTHSEFPESFYFEIVNMIISLNSCIL